MTVADLLAIAIQHHQTGRLAQAEQVYRQILQLQPNHLEALRLLGVIAYQTGHLVDAAQLLQQVITLQPNHAEAHNNLGTVLRQQGQLEAAIAHLQQATTLNPQAIDAHYNLGNALQEAGEWERATRQYQQVINLNPNHAEAYCNLGNVLAKQGKLKLAIDHYQRAIALKPGLAVAHYNLGNALRDQNQLEQAIVHYRQAIQLHPDYLDAHYNLGLALMDCHQYGQAASHYQHILRRDPGAVDAVYQLGQTAVALGNFAGAIAHFQHTLTLNPNVAPAHVGLAEVLTKQSQVGLAIQHFQTAWQLDPTNLTAYLRSLLILPIAYDNPVEILQHRQRFCRGLNQLHRHLSLTTLTEREQAMNALAKHTNFYLAYQGLNDRGLQTKYGKLVHRIMTANFPQWARCDRPNSQGKIRIGYVSTFFQEHVVAKLMMGWWRECDRQQFVIHTYHLGEKQDAITTEFASLSDVFYHIPSNPEAACEQIRADQLDILVFTDLGMASLTFQLAALRLAPVQCVGWGHPVTTGLPTIDYFLSSELMEPSHGHTHYAETLVRLPNLGICYAKPTVPALTKTRADFHLRQDAVVYLACQSLFKYLPQFDWIFAGIAARVPSAQFVFIDHPAAVAPKLQTRLQRVFALQGLNWQDYCVFLPFLNSSDYWQLHQIADVFLDSLGWSGGNTTLEAIACGLPVVTCPGEFMRSRHSAAMLQMMGVPETIAPDVATYIEIAARLGNEPAWCNQVRQKIVAGQDRLYGDRSSVRALEAFYRQVLSASTPPTAIATVKTVETGGVGAEAPSQGFHPCTPS